NRTRSRVSLGRPLICRACPARLALPLLPHRIGPVSANPGWYPDPGGGQGLFRYWDGKAWSAATSPNPSAPPPLQGLVSGGTPQQGGPASGQEGQPYGQGGQPAY